MRTLEYGARHSIEWNQFSQMEKIKGIIIVENTIIFAEYQNDKRRVTCKNMKRNGLNGSHVVC
jgi:hypothetical protein